MFKRTFFLVATAIVLFSGIKLQGQSASIEDLRADFEENGICFYVTYSFYGITEGEIIVSFYNNDGSILKDADEKQVVTSIKFISENDFGIDITNDELCLLIPYSKLFLRVGENERKIKVEILDKAGKSIASTGFYEFSVNGSIDEEKSLEIDNRLQQRLQEIQQEYQLKLQAIEQRYQHIEEDTEQNSTLRRKTIMIAIAVVAAVSLIIFIICLYNWIKDQPESPPYLYDSKVDTPFRSSSRNYEPLGKTGQGGNSGGIEN